MIAALFLMIVSSSCTKHNEIAVIRPTTNIFCKCPSCIKVTANVSNNITSANEVSARWDTDYMRGSGRSTLGYFAKE